MHSDIPGKGDTSAEQYPPLYKPGTEPVRIKPTHPAEITVVTMVLLLTVAACVVQLYSAAVLWPEMSSTIGNWVVPTPEEQARLDDYESVQSHPWMCSTLLVPFVAIPLAIHYGRRKKPCMMAAWIIAGELAFGAMYVFGWLFGEYISQF